MSNILPVWDTTPSIKSIKKVSFSKGQPISGYSHILSELISRIIVSAFLKTINFISKPIYWLRDFTRRYIILSQGC